MVTLRNFIISVSVIFIPHNTTALVQPLNQEIIANVKAAYTREIFTFLIATTDIYKVISAMEEEHAVA